jgi:hypothetical protein
MNRKLQAKIPRLPEEMYKCLVFKYAHSGYFQRLVRFLHLMTLYQMQILYA